MITTSSQPSDRDRGESTAEFACQQHPSVVASHRFVDDAMCSVTASRAAQQVLREIYAGTGHPDELAEQLLALMVGADERHRRDIIKGFLRPIEKRIEADAAKVKGTS